VNSEGGSKPRSGWRQRTNASNPQMRSDWTVMKG
jgi:hypothetical protein